mgnify:CR=1 FL=1
MCLFTTTTPTPFVPFSITQVAFVADIEESNIIIARSVCQTWSTCVPVYKTTTPTPVALGADIEERNIIIARSQTWSTCVPVYYSLWPLPNRKVAFGVDINPKY